MLAYWDTATTPPYGAAVPATLLAASVGFLIYYVIIALCHNFEGGDSQ